MEQRITINGSTWIVPSSRVPDLLGWLKMNAVNATEATKITEIKQQDDSQLLCG